MLSSIVDGGHGSHAAAGRPPSENILRACGTHALYSALVGLLYIFTLLHMIMFCCARTSASYMYTQWQGQPVVHSQ